VRCDEVGAALGLDPSGVHVDAAQVLALGHVNVALVAPGGAPGVLDDPVLGGGGVESDGQDGVVQLGATRAREDTRLVRLEATRGIDGDTDGADEDGGGERGLSGALDGLVGLHDGIAGLATGAVTGGVGVVSLGARATISEVVDGLVVPATVAALVAIRAGAVNELLLAERVQLATGDGAPALDDAGGGEGPARTALLLSLTGVTACLSRQSTSFSGVAATKFSALTAMSSGEMSRPVR